MRCNHIAIYALAPSIYILIFHFISYFLFLTPSFASPSLLPSDIPVELKKWSDPESWPDHKVPTEDEDVFIPPNLSILLDVPELEVGSLFIQGKLVFANIDIQLKARWILVTGKNSLFQIGTEKQAFRKKVRIILNGPKEKINEFGGRFLGVSNGGSLEFHGHASQKLSWTQLASSVRAGSIQVSIKDIPTKWNIGDKIILAPSSIDPNESEELSITGISGNTLYVSPPLSHYHLGEMSVNNRQSLDQRAELGMLTRNITIIGQEQVIDEHTNESYGAHILIKEDAGPIHIEGVEFAYLGQPGPEGYFAIHWNQGGSKQGDYIRNSSLHHSFYSGIVLDGTDNVLIENMVLSNIVNHALIPALKGTEKDNVFKNNLVINIKAPDETNFSFRKLNSRQSFLNEHRPAGFYMKNPYQHLTGNHVAGVAKGVGYFFDASLRVEEAKSYDFSGIPVIFEHNTAHSIDVDNDFNRTDCSESAHGLGLFLDKFFNGEFPWVFESFTAYEVEFASIWNNSPQLILRNSISQDRGLGYLIGPGKIENSYLYGQNELEIHSYYPLKDEETTANHKIEKINIKMGKVGNDFIEIPININSELENNTDITSRSADNEMKLPIFYHTIVVQSINQDIAFNIPSFSELYTFYGTQRPSVVNEESYIKVSTKVNVEKVFISFFLTSNSMVKLVIYDISGRKIVQLLDEKLAAGHHEILFDGKHLPGGLYFHFLTINGRNQVGKFLLEK